MSKIKQFGASIRRDIRDGVARGPGGGGALVTFFFWLLVISVFMDIKGLVRLVQSIFMGVPILTLGNVILFALGLGISYVMMATLADIRRRRGV